MAQLGKRQTFDCRVDSHLGCGVVSLNKTLYPSCLLLVKPRMSFQND